MSFLAPGLTSSGGGASGLGSCSLGKELGEASASLLMSIFPGPETLKTSWESEATRFIVQPSANAAAASSAEEKLA